MAQVPFCMALSTMFTDGKIANNIGSLLLIFPIVIFVNFLAMNDNSKYWLYALNWIPVIPGCSLLVILSSTDKAVFPLYDLSWVSSPVMWISLILNIPLWFCIYFYLDQVMPSTYGVQKHPLFCFKKS